MVRHMSAVLLTVAALNAHALAGERNYTMRGDGWFDTANERFGRLALREARLTVRDNGEFAVTLFVRNERYLVKGRWDRRGRGGVDRIDIIEAFGQRASGTGSLTYRREGNAPAHLQLEGRTREGPFRAEISDGRGDDWFDRANERRDDRDFGRGNRLSRNLDVSVIGSGMLRFSREPDGRLRNLRARLDTDRDVRLEFSGPTRGTVRAEVTDVRDNRITARVREVFGVRASGEVVIVMRDREMIERITGSGGSEDGSWQLDFDGRTRGDDRWDRENEDWSRDRDTDWPRGGRVSDEMRGSGWLRQDVGPDLSFDRMRVILDVTGEATVVLEGRRQPLRLAGRWSGRGDEVRVNLSQVNERRARGQLTLRRDGRRVESLRGEGRTDMGRFEVRFGR